MKVFGLTQLSKKVNELLIKDTKDKDNPDKWTWKPSKPDKIKNIREIVKEEKDSVDYSLITNYTISDKRQKVVLCFSSGNLSYGLIKQFEEKNIKYIFINYTQFVLQGSVLISFNEQVESMVLSLGDVKFKLDDISAVIWTQPRYPRDLFDVSMIPQENENLRNAFLHKKRWAQLIKDLKFLLNSDTQWLPSDPFVGSQDSQNKLGEYKLACELGINIPKTIFTNDKDAVLEFSKNNNHKILLREFSTPPFSFPPIHIDIRETDLDGISAAPCYFQAYVEKIHEYRVVMLFDKIYPCKIHSQDSELTQKDWRVHDDAKVKWELATLPDDLIQKLLKLKEKLGLNWCSVDLIYSTDHKYYFLEMNRPGAHYWLDLFVGLDITKEIADILLEKKIVEQL